MIFMLSYHILFLLRIGIEASREPRASAKFQIHQVLFHLFQCLGMPKEDCRSHTVQVFNLYEDIIIFGTF